MWGLFLIFQFKGGVKHGGNGRLGSEVEKGHLFRVGTEGLKPVSFSAVEVEKVRAVRVS